MSRIKRQLAFGRRIAEILQGDSRRQSWWVVVVCGLAYGAVMGSFGGRAGQMAYSAVKVPLLLGATVLLTLPCFFMVNTLLGLRDDFATALRGVIASQAGLTILLVSLAPITLFWYASSGVYQQAILFNGVMFGIASLGAQVILRRAYRPLIARNPIHQRLLKIWLVLYAFVGIQMGWILRPFIGEPSEPTQFFRPGAWDNAYEIVAKMAWSVFTR